MGSAVAANEDVAITLEPLDIVENTAAASGLETVWLELQSGGLTYDLSGLAPGEPICLPQVDNWLGVPETERAERLRCVGLALGPHVRGGQGVVPVLRGLLGIAAKLSAHFAECRGACWAASGTFTSREVFIDLVEHWLGGGAFPAQLFATFSQGTEGALESRGLAYFTGQEIRIEARSTADREQAIMLGLRIVGQLAYRGPVLESEQSMTPDGTPVQLEPSKDGKIIRVLRV